MPDRRLPSFLAAVVAIALAAGCQNDQPPPPQPAEEPRQTPANDVIEEDPMRMETPETPSLDEAVAMARHALADRLETVAEDIEVVEARRVTWPNGALGCPREGEMYTQALVEGLYILLTADGEHYAYHAGRDRVPFPCPANRSEPPSEQKAPTR